MALVGNLKDLKLPNLIQLNCIEKNVARLTISHLGMEGHLFFEDGQITHAEYQTYTGEDAVYRLLTLFEGEFRVENSIRPKKRTVQTSWNMLILEGMRLLDEKRETADTAVEKFIKELKGLEGVRTVFVINNDGTLTTPTDSPTDKKNAALALFAVEKSKAFGELMNWGSLRHFVVQLKEQKLLILEHDSYQIYLGLDLKAPVDPLIPAVEKMAKKI